MIRDNVQKSIASQFSARGTAGQTPSLHDSAYVTSDQQSFETTSTVRHETHSRRGQAIGNGYFFFEAEIDQDTERYFENVSELLGRLFFNHIRKARSKNPDLNPLLIELRVLGKSEADA